MKKWGLLVILLLLGVTVLAEERKEQVTPPAETEKSRESTSKKPVERSTQRTQQPTWPRPYSPTEEVRADSVVPFPVDI